jgi:hypothetical protein
VSCGPLRRVLVGSFAVVGLVAGLCVVGSVASAASPNGATARLDVVAGDGGLFIPGRSLPVRVTVHSDRLFKGELSVTAGAERASEAVEVAGGGDKQFELVVATTTGAAQLSAQVALTDGRTVVASAASTINAGTDTEVVGLLPELLVGRTPPSSATLSVDLGTARLVALSDQDLAAAPASLGPLTAVALGPNGLVDLDAATRNALLAWTAGGGRLMIDAGAGDTVPGLPPAWQPASGSSRAAAGTGEIVLTSGAMSAGHWDGLVDPASHAAGGPVQNGFNGNESLGTALAGVAGLKTPHLSWLIAFLAAYVVLVGPVAFFLLRRRRWRPELLWVAIPVVSLLFAATGYAVGSSSRAHLPAVHGTVVDTSVPGGTAVSYVGVLSAGQGTTSFTAPATWQLQQYNDPALQSSAKSAVLDVVAAATATKATLHLDAGQFTVMQATGPAGLAGALTVSAAATAGGGVRGTVVNQTPYTLRDVAVLIGNVGTNVGTVAPGAHVQWSVGPGPSTPTGVLIEDQLWNGGNSSSGVVACGPKGQIFSGPASTAVFAPGAIAVPAPAIAGVGPGSVNGGIVSFGPLGPCGVATAASNTSVGASLPVWAAGPAGLTPQTREPGTAVAVGWTNQYQPPVSVSGRGKPSRGNTAIVGTSPIDATVVPSALAIPRQVVRGNLIELSPVDWADPTNSGSAVALRWRVPASAQGHALSLTVPTGVANTAVWTTHGWRLLNTAPTSTSTSISPLTTLPNGGVLQVPTTVLGSPFPLTTPPQVLSPGPPPTFPGALAIVPLTPADVVGGAVYLRLGGGVAVPPFNLGAVQLGVQS